MSPHDPVGTVYAMLSWRDMDVRQADAAPGENPGRTITAQLATYGTVNRPQSAWGIPVRLAAGALETPADINAVKFLRDHDSSRVIGAMTTVEQTDQGLSGTFRIGRTQDADEALSLASDGILDAVSVGYAVHDASIVVEADEEILNVTRASLFEVSLVGRPADSSARIDSVTARKAPAMTLPALPTPDAPPAPEVHTFTDAQMDAIHAQLTARMAPADAAPIAPPAVTRSTLVDQAGNPIVLASARDRFDPRIPSALGRDGRRYTAGDFFASYARGTHEGDWTKHHEIKAALADELTSDVPGLLPRAIVGELLGRATGRRAVWDSLSTRDMPMAGAGFSRPRITQHVKVDTQATQKTEVASQKYTVALDEVSKSTLAGALDVAQQAIDWTSPALLNELIIDFTRIYLSRTDSFASAALVAATTAGAQNVVWDGTAATLTKALADAAVLVYNGVSTEVDSFPNTIWISPDVWALLAGLVDTTGRPLFPQVGPMNASGTVDLTNPESGVSAMGFRWVVSKRLPAKTFIMGDAAYAESYENGRRFLQAIRPDVLGLDIAYMGYVATYFPYPKTLVKITITPAAPLAAK